MKTLCQSCILLFAVSLSTPGWAANPQSPPDLTRSGTEIPFRLYAGYLIVVEGRIGDRSNLRFVLDTGVTHSVIDRRLAGNLSIARRSGKVLNFDKTVPADWVEVPNIQFGPIDVPQYSMMIGDLRYFQSFAPNVDAVVGLDLLRLSSFSINYDTHKIFFGPLDTTSGVPMSSGPICLSVQLLVGNSEVRLLVDTGAQALVLYEDQVRNRIPQLRITGEIDGSSMGGSVHAKRALLPKSRLGMTDLDRTVFLVKAPPGNLLPGIDGYLGTTALKARCHRRVDLEEILLTIV